MKYRRKIREYPPVFVAVLLSILVFAFGTKAIGGSAAETVQLDKCQTSEVTQETKVQTEMTQALAQPEIEQQPLIYSRDWDAQDREILLKIAMAEAEGEDVEGKALVMLVVLNRVWSDGFPGTISEVVFQEKQFSPTAEGGRYWTTEPDKGCYKAIELIESGWDESRGALYFESCEGDSWHSRNLEFLFQHGNHKFYK